MERVILHADMNNFYASVECLYNPSLRGKPIAVVGDPEARHGIVLAKNNAAKSCGVLTGNPLWMAKRNCPDIIFVSPHDDLYMKYSRIAREIYGEYTDRVEPYGLDECWLDVTGSTNLFGGGKSIADQLRERIKKELGITASVGVSYNKIFAKLGSDMKKPDATTVISRDRFRETVWPLPVNELFYVGRATHNKLRRYGIQIIGGLAQTDQELLRCLLGQNGVMLWLFANGMDSSPVSDISAKSLVKSIGNSTTAPRDLVTEEIKIILYVLCESVSARMREYGFLCRIVQLGLCDRELHSYERQGKLSYPNRTAISLCDKAFSLYKQHHTSGKPVRSLCVRALDLPLREYEKLSFLPDISEIQTEELLESKVDRIRGRFGSFSIQRELFLFDRQLSSLNPKEEHIIHPEVFFKNENGWLSGQIGY